MTRAEHTAATGHIGWETSLDLCLREGVKRGLHGWQPEPDDQVATVYRCQECYILLDETPATEVSDGH